MATLDILHPPSSESWLGYGVAISGALLIASVLAGVVTTRLERADLEKQREEVRATRAVVVRPNQASNAPAAPAARPADLAAAQRVMSSLATPWRDLFNAVEGGTVEGVVLLAIEPDAAGGSVRVDAEARDLAALLRYLTRMERRDELHRVHLTAYSPKKNNELSVAPSVAAPVSTVSERTKAAASPVSFSMQAGWRKGTR